MSVELMQLRVRKELEAWPPRPDLWAHAAQLSAGDENRAKEIYITFRVAELKMAATVRGEAPSARALSGTRDAHTDGDTKLRPESRLGRWCWRATACAISNESIFNLILGSFVTVMTFSTLFLNTLGSRAWWLVLPVGQVANLYLAYRLSNHPICLLAATKGAQARLHILLHIFVLTVLVAFLSIVMPLMARHELSWP